MNKKKVQKNFFVDIDGTITNNNSEKNLPEEKLVLGNPIFGVIRDVMVEEGWNPEEAKRKIEEYANRIIWWDYPDFIIEFNLPIQKTWENIYQWHEEYQIVFKDTVRLIKRLYKRGENLFVVSNNPIVGCLLKLKRAGLGEISGSTYFKRILGANILRGQKHQIELWRRAIAQVGIEPEKIITIGDNQKEDGEIPILAGIKTAIIIKRDLNKSIEIQNGIIFIKKPIQLLNYNI